MIRIFAYIRRVLALDKAARGIAAIAAEIVKDELIPRLNAAAKEATNEREKAKLEAMAAEYEMYTKKGTSEYRDLENTAEAAIVSEVRLFGLSEDFEDEATSMVVQDFYVPATSGGKDLRRSLSDFPVERTSRAFEFTKFFSRVVKMRAHWRLREEIRKNPGEYEKHQDLEEHPGSSVMDRLRSRSISPVEDVERREESEGMDDSGDQDAQVARIQKQMADFVKKHAKDDVTKALYDAWIRTVELHGPAVNLNRDVYPALAQTYGVSQSGLNERFMAIKRLIERFFREELGVRMTDALKRKLHIGAVEVLTFECFRRRFAAWMLCVDAP